jgi:hypothetical protein
METPAGSSREPGPSDLPFTAPAPIDHARACFISSSRSLASPVAAFSRRRSPRRPTVTVRGLFPNLPVNPIHIKYEYIYE